MKVEWKESAIINKKRKKKFTIRRENRIFETIEKSTSIEALFDEPIETNR